MHRVIQRAIGALGLLACAGLVAGVVVFVSARDDDQLGPIAARPAPAEPPAPVVADGACGDAMDAIRSIQQAWHSGAELDDTGNAALTAGLSRLDASCSADLAGEFREREVTPWLTYLPASFGAAR